MAARTPSLLNAAIELAFVVAAGALGYLKAPLWSVPALALAMMGYWAFNRRAGLEQARRVGMGRLVGLIAVSLAIMCVVLGATYWLGSAVGGKST